MKYRLFLHLSDKALHISPFIGCEYDEKRIPSTPHNWQALATAKFHREIFIVLVQFQNSKRTIGKQLFLRPCRRGSLITFKTEERLLVLIYTQLAAHISRYNKIYNTAIITLYFLQHGINLNPSSRRDHLGSR